MPEFSFFKINDSHDALKIEFFSPEELQMWSRAIGEIPDGQHLVIRKGSSAQKRPTLLLGLTEVGKPLVLEGEDAGEVAANPVPPVPRALEIPEVVKNASDAQLQVMAAKNGITVDEAWTKRPKTARQADVAAAMKKMNAR